MDREAVMTALLNTVAAAAGFITTGRDLLHHSQVAAQPALFAVDAEEDFPAGSYNMPRAIEMAAELWVYTKGDERPDKSPAKALNATLDAIETALAPSPINNVQTLGGAAEHCWIEGRIEKSPGHVLGQAVAVIPIKMLVPR